MIYRALYDYDLCHRPFLLEPWGSLNSFTVGISTPAVWIVCHCARCVLEWHTTRELGHSDGFFFSLRNTVDSFSLKKSPIFWRNIWLTWRKIFWVDLGCENHEVPHGLFFCIEIHQSCRWAVGKPNRDLIVGSTLICVRDISQDDNPEPATPGWSLFQGLLDLTLQRDGKATCCAVEARTN